MSPLHDPLANPAGLIERVYAYVAYRVGPGAHAEDVTSEVFERALRYRGSYDARKGSPISWLIGIARRVLADDAARPHELAYDEQPELAAPDAFADEVVDRLMIRDAVARLPERDRDLIALRYGADLTAGQIARILGMRTNTVEVTLYRALAVLRRLVRAGTDVVEESPLHRIRI